MVWIKFRLGREEKGVPRYALSVERSEPVTNIYLNEVIFKIEITG